MGGKSHGGDIPADIIANLAEREREILDFDSEFEVSGHTTKVSSFCFSFAGAKMYRICLESRKIARAVFLVSCLSLSDTVLDVKTVLYLTLAKLSDNNRSYGFETVDT